MVRGRPRGTRQRDAAGGWPPLPLRPMLAVASARLPTAGRGGGWAYEYKWDGIRLLVAWDGRELRLISRNGLDVTGGYPELSGPAGLGAALGRTRRLVLDGELIALDDAGRPSFQQLQRRLNVRRGGVPAVTRRLLAEVPVVYMVFDILCEGDEPLIDLAYEDRRERLQSLHLEGGHWRTPPWQIDEGRAMLDAAMRVGLEGVMAKRLGSVYRPGVRSDDWLKIKIRKRQDFAVVGWTEMRGSPGQIGSLLVGYRDEATGDWRLAGQVGSGLSEAHRRDLRPALERIERPDSVVTDPLPLRRERVHHVEPAIVVEVSFHEWTAGGGLRHPVCHGLRIDKNADEVRREP